MFPIVPRNIGWFAALLVFQCGLYVRAQAPIIEEPNYKPTLTFDVATIRPSPPPDANFHLTISSPPHSSRFEATNFPMKALLQIAYGFDAPVVGAPDWVANTFYDIKTRSDEAADARLAKLTDNEVRLEKRNAMGCCWRTAWASRRTLKLAIPRSITSKWAKTASRCRLCRPAPPAANGRGAASAATHRRPGAWIAAWPRIRRIEFHDARPYRRPEFDGRSARS